MRNAPYTRNQDSGVEEFLGIRFFGRRIAYEKMPGCSRYVTVTVGEGRNGQTGLNDLQSISGYLSNTALALLQFWVIHPATVEEFFGSLSIQEEELNLANHGDDIPEGHVRYGFSVNIV